MQKFAVVRINGKQYIAEEEKEILVDKVSDPKIIKYDVLLFVDGEKIEVGTPILEKAKVVFKVILEVEKGKKIDIFKYKAKSRERRHVGFRPQFTRLLVEKISN